MENSKFFISDRKITQYLLLPGAKHANDFFSVGYKTSNPEILYRDIFQQYDDSAIVDLILTEDGAEKFSIFMELGVIRKRRFRTVWIKDTKESKPRFITAYRQD